MGIDRRGNKSEALKRRRIDAFGGDETQQHKDLRGG